MFVLDSNVLLDAANQRSHFHPPCLGLVERCRKGSDLWFLTWSICYEFLRASTHARGFSSPLPAPEAVRFLSSLMASSQCRVLVHTDRHAAVLAQTLQEHHYLSGNVMHDVHIAVLMREHGLRRIYTRDTDFHKFKFLQVLDPRSPAP
jgi:hypothetical protein